MINRKTEIHQDRQAWPTMTDRLDQDVFRLLVEQSPDAAAIIGAAGNVTYVSPAVESILGYTPEEFMGFSPFELVHPGDRASAQVRFAELLGQPGVAQNVVNRVRHKDSSWRWIETFSKNCQDGSAAGSIVARFRDVSARMRAEESIREAEEKFRLIVESATEFAIFTTDLDGRVSSWNTGATRLLGYTEEEVLGRDCRLIFTPEDNATEAPEGEMEEALTSGRGTDERWHLRKDGSRFWGSGLMMPLQSAEGIRGYLKIFRDATRAKRAEKALEDEIRRKDEFLAVLAHELRNPLSAIRNASLVLGLESVANPLKWATEIIDRQSTHLARLLDDLLDISRITQGKIRLRMEDCDLWLVVARAVGSMKQAIESKKHQVTIDVDPAPGVVHADSTRIEQVLVNILSNAIKYTDDGGSISIRAWRDHDVARVAIRDNGIGLSAEMLTRVFKPFVQVDESLHRSEGGLGIGLALARTLVEMHGGTIHATSGGLGQGAEFIVTLPCINESQVGDKNSQTPQPAARRQKVLLVDDNRDGAASLGKLLELAGNDVAMAFDGYEAMRVVGSENPDVVLLDIGLPGLDGYEVARRLRQVPAHRNCLLIAVSGYGQDSDKERARQAGFDHHMVKPVDFQQLCAFMSAHAPGHHLPN